MLITKVFTVESAHIVRNCTSERCSHSIHGHSAKIEVAFEAKTLDNAQMVMDFGLMKNEIKKFIDSMDHCYLLCKYDSQEFKDFIKKSCDRWIELPFNPSAEMLSMFVMWGVDRILDNMKFNNGEGEVSVFSVKYHETATGSAICTATDMNNIWNEMISRNPDEWEIVFSPGIQMDWGLRSMNVMFGLPTQEESKMIVNPKIPMQIKLN